MCSERNNLKIHSSGNILKNKNYMILRKEKFHLNENYLAQKYQNGVIYPVMH